jgi:hypothetical protein
MVISALRDADGIGHPARLLWLLGAIPLVPFLFLGYFGDDWAALDSFGPGGWGLVLQQLAPHGGEFYRPLGFVFLQLEIIVSTGLPMINHLIHLGLFVFAAWLTGVLAERIVRKPVAPWVAILALVYPGRIEAGMWMIAIFDLLAMILVLIGLILFLSPREKDRWMLMAILAFLAPAAKEVGFSLPLVVTAWWALGLVRGPCTKLRLMAAWAGTAAAAGLRLAAFGGVGGYTGIDVFDKAVANLKLLPTVTSSALFAPVNTSLGVTAYLIAAICASAVVGVAVGWLRNHDLRGSKKLAAAGGTIMLLTLLPALPFLNRDVVWNHSRFMSLPAVGIVLIVSALLIHDGGIRRAASWAFALVWSVATVFNLIPWFEGARAQEVIFEGIEAATREPGPHTVWLDGPIGGFSGNHLFGGHLEFALRVRFPGRDIDSDSRFLQRLQGREQGPPMWWRGTLHVLRFARDPPRLRFIATRPAIESALPSEEQ